MAILRVGTTSEESGKVPDICAGIGSHEHMAARVHRRTLHHHALLFQRLFTN